MTILLLNGDSQDAAWIEACAKANVTPDVVTQVWGSEYATKVNDWGLQSFPCLVSETDGDVTAVVYDPTLVGA